MVKRLAIKTGEYKKDGATKGEYIKLGVVLTNDNGSYVLLDPAINLAGALIKQNLLARKAGKPERDMLMVSIFTDEPRNDQRAQHPQKQASGNAPADVSFDDDIPF